MDTKTEVLRASVEWGELGWRVAVFCAVTFGLFLTDPAPKVDNWVGPICVALAYALGFVSGQLRKPS